VSQRISGITDKVIATVIGGLILYVIMNSDKLFALNHEGSTDAYFF